jgi:dolichol-phosphate mannosyltransferase
MQLSVIVPTFNEGDNVAELLTRLDHSLTGIDAEVLIIDDGSDHLPETAAATPVKLPVRVIRREVAEGRLGGAVVHGMHEARGTLLLVLDGDLQHPPELIPEMVAAAQQADMVVASRYIDGGDAGGLSNGVRKFVSRSTGLVTKFAFPYRLKSCTDPMSGFFLVRRSKLDLASLKPKGFKILLEIIARSRPMRVTEVPFVFGVRTAGESHASLAEGFRFLRQLALLRVYNRAVLFMLVGASGIIPNLAVAYGLTGVGVHYVTANIIAIQVAVIWNFLGAEFLVWKDHDGGHWAKRFTKFLAVAETDLIRIPFVVLLVHVMGGHSVTASAITLAAAFLLRFTLADKIVYRRRVATAVVNLEEQMEHIETAPLEAT